ncbi:MAG: acyl-protein synthetase [Acidobacteriota bacterium]
MRVARFVDAARAGSDSGTAGEPASTTERFERLVLGVFRLQRTDIEPYARLCDARGVEVDTVASDGWRAVPPVPVAAFRSLRLAAAPAREIFRSSGTTQGAAHRSVHHHPFPDLYRHVIDATFADACLPGGWSDGEPAPRRPLLALVPPRAQAPDSSLSFMVEHILERHGDPACTAFGASGVDVEAAERFTAARAADGRPATVLATAFALAQWLDARPASAPPLPEGSTVFETGGFKGRRRELSRDELRRLIATCLGVPAAHVVREYGMTELTGHVYTRALHGGDPDRFVPPPWMRVRAVDPESLDEVAPGTPGLAAILDLANVGSALHVLAEDLVVVEPSGSFRLLGRAPGAQLRGCSLTVEELLDML